MLKLTVLPDTLAVCRLDASSPIPVWADGDGFVSITRTADELSIVCREAFVPSDVRVERDWRAFTLEGPFDFAFVGVLKQVLDPLAEAHIGVFVISSFDTDTVLVKAVQFEQAVTALTRYGHTLRMQVEVIDVKCGWRLPDGSRTTATYRAQVIEYDPTQDRWLVTFVGMRATDADATTQTLIEAQVGKWAYVPSEARRGMTLPLKYETLTGKPRWFYADDPRK